METKTFYVRDQQGDFVPAAVEDIVGAARAHLNRRVRRGTTLSSPGATRAFLTLKLGTLDHECFAVIFLDKRHRVIEYVEMFRGTIDGASVHPREVVKDALKLNAAAVPNEPARRPPYVAPCACAASSTTMSSCRLANAVTASMSQTWP